MTTAGRDPSWVAETFDRRAPTYDESLAHHWQAEVSVELLPLEPNLRLLDLAAGTGLVARAVEARNASVLVVSLDVSDAMLRVAARESRGPAVRADAGVLPFADDAFDLLTCVAGMPYLPDLGGAVTEWTRVARPGATIVVTTPAVDGTPELRLVREASAGRGLPLEDPYADLGSPDRVRSVLGGLGLDVEAVESRSFPADLSADPDAAFDHVLDYGFAERLRSADADLREAVLDAFTTAYEALRKEGSATHDVLFTRARLP